MILNSSSPERLQAFPYCPIVTVNANVCHTLLELPWLPQYIFIIINTTIFFLKKKICATIIKTLIQSLFDLSIIFFFITISLCNKKLRGDVINSVYKRDFCAMHQLLSFSLSPTLELSRSTQRTRLEHFLFVQTLSKTKLSLRALYRWINCTTCVLLDVALLHIVHGRGALGAMVPLLLCTFALAEAEAPKTHLRCLSCSLGASKQIDKKSFNQRWKKAESKSDQTNVLA